MTSRAKAEARKARAIERNKSLQPDKVFNTKPTELLNMVDAVFHAAHEMSGWVVMAANSKGRDQVNGLFPNAHIEWGNRTDLGPDRPADWLGFTINLPDVIAAAQTKLPLDAIPAGRTIDDSTPDQLALLLAFGVQRAGGRAAILIQDQETRAVRCEIFTPHEN